MFRAQRMLQETTKPVAVTWRKVEAVTAYGHSYVTEHLAGAQASWTFRRRHIVLGVKGRTAGTGTSVAIDAFTVAKKRTATPRLTTTWRVYVDGVRKAIVDNYSASSLTKVRRLVRGLADRVHTVRIVVLGKHHKGARGNTVTVDRFVIC